MLKKDFNFRKCIFCNNRFKKEKLIRFYIKDKKIYLSSGIEQKYHGFYICNNNEHFKKIIEKKHKYLNVNKFDESLVEYLKRYQ